MGKFNSKFIIIGSLLNLFKDNKMNKNTLTNLILFFFLAAGLQAQNRYTVEDVPNVQLQDYARYVSDPENALDIADVLALDERLAQLRDSMGIQTAVVVLPAIDTGKYGSAKEFASELFNQWGIGDKESNNGLLILLLTAEGDREVVFETGYGLEEKLTDGLCKLIQTKKMIPLLKEGEYGNGLLAGVNEVEEVLKGTSELLKKEPLLSKSGWIALIWLVGGFIIILLVEQIRKKRIADSDNQYALAAKYSSLSGIGCVMAILFFPAYLVFMIYKEIAKKDDFPPLNCEKCHGKGTVILKGQPVIEQDALPGQDGMKKYNFFCTACKHTHKELISYKYDQPQTKSSGKGSTDSSSRSSGSRGGGSWGGGSSGGGGASTKF